MEADRFDALAKGLAGGLSRRRVLRGLGGTVVGGLLTGFGVRRGGAAPGGNSICARWCHATFGGAAAGQCTSAAAQGEGPCYGCAGPRGQACPAGQACGPDGTCQPILGCRTPPCCGLAGDSCASDADCCNGVPCVANACSSCGPAGQLCVSDTDCCSGLVCGSGGTCRACAAVGQPCARAADCCGGTVCANGACAACPAGCVALENNRGARVCGDLATAACGACAFGGPCPAGAACIPLDAGPTCSGACVALC